MKIEQEIIKVTTIDGSAVEPVVDYGNVGIWATPDRNKIYLTDNSLNVLCRMYRTNNDDYKIEIYDILHGRGVL